ncbi:helix-turn-helix transcriptional regulator [Pseudomonas sp. DP16D-R1]|uniref:helix-turn-helix transcriptional regulator n=1 Tax=Pseudomonas sp. DP16D-R1 TaxID=2075551 RepID=UPI000CCFF4C6|nr:helix-turn-helix transcriptional regulator [Pseudomonas sp. DP16D-R1]POA72305.1 transcriptional regulator [Pseudomonas sp. DP16D-R1]
MELNDAFALALRGMRLVRHMPQQRFFGTTSRAYMTHLEQGRRCPGLAKIEDLAAVMDVHPASMVVECYLKKNPEMDLDGLLAKIKLDLTFEYFEPVAAADSEQVSE